MITQMRHRVPVRLIASVLVALAGCIAEEPLDVEASTQNLRTGVSDEGEVLVGADVLVTGRSSEHGLLGGGGDAFGLIRESPCPVISV